MGFLFVDRNGCKTNLAHSLDCANHLARFVPLPLLHFGSLTITDGFPAPRLHKERAREGISFALCKNCATYFLTPPLLLST
jgi:hypothetical protein